MAFAPTRRLLSDCVNRAITYTQNGDPSKVLGALSYRALPPPTTNTVNVRFILAPINPADINVIEGVYPAKPSPDITLKESNHEPIYVGGNEGLARVTDVGEGVKGFKKDDWVVMTKPQIGTWCTAKNVAVDEVVRIPRVEGLSEVNAATITVSFRGVVWVEG
jgi:trans-2-enoyl-CoA reductase